MRSEQFAVIFWTELVLFFFFFKQLEHTTFCKFLYFKGLDLGCCKTFPPPPEIPGALSAL